MSYKVGDVVPYRNTRGNRRFAKITSFQTVDNGKNWFNGIDVLTEAKVWYPVHISEKLVKIDLSCELENQHRKPQKRLDTILKV